MTSEKLRASITTVAFQKMLVVEKIATVISGDQFGETSHFILPYDERGVDEDQMWHPGLCKALAMEDRAFEKYRGKEA
ncbi:hypothetical protein CYMTET_18551 [Cymbomonas tetramitiformis]|uniref:Uncharacterized protein n=1 Tax=Cymbomonas tetramitiformis TaxID=36881 RepID=A0AAE0G7S9_9CHLO|nr:hypothetical protein CYMTET_18551 [Cymbomonas tetramitiformis]